MVDTKNRKLFLFDESTEIKLKLQLFYKEHGGRTSAVINSAIKYKDGCITLYTEDFLTSMDHNKGLSFFFMNEFSKSDYRIKEACIGDQAINLKIEEKLMFNNSYMENGRRCISMELKRVLYSYRGMPTPKLYRLTTLSSSLISPYLTGLNVIGNKVVGTQPVDYLGGCYNKQISLSRDERYVYLEAEDYVSDIISVLSFFFSSPIEYDMAYSITKDGTNFVEVRTQKYKALAVKKNNILGYLFGEEEICLDYLTDFLKITCDCGKKLPLADSLKQYIDHYVRVEYLDSISRLLLYHTIIEKMAGVGKDTDTYNIIHKFLKKMHIDVEKLNDRIANRKIENEEGQIIDNFVQLRYFFVHHLGSKEAVAFLEESEMLYNIKAAITIIILKELGVQNVWYDKKFHALSIYDESVKECDTFIGAGL